MVPKARVELARVLPQRFLSLTNPVSVELYSFYFMPNDSGILVREHKLVPSNITVSELVSGQIVGIILNRLRQRGSCRSQQQLLSGDSEEHANRYPSLWRCWNDLISLKLPWAGVLK